MRALVLGLGESGLAMARHLAREGHEVHVHDSRAGPPGLAALRAEQPATGFASGPWPEGPFDGLAMVAISPGLSPHEPAIQALLARARKSGAEVVGEIELFARALAKLREERGYAPKIIGAFRPLPIPAGPKAESHQSVAAALAVIHHAPHTVRPALDMIVFHAFHSGLEVACLAGAVVALLGAAAAFRLLPGREKAAAASAAPGAAEDRCDGVLVPA